MKGRIKQLADDLNGDKLTDFLRSTCKTTMPDPEMLSGPDTLRELVRNAPRTRDKTLLMLLWFTGGNIRDTMAKWTDVRFKT